MPRSRAALALFLASTLIACGAPRSSPPAEPSGHSGLRTSSVATDAKRKRYLLKRDAEVTVKEPAPHQGVGETTAYRYFDELGDAGLIFRKRALHRGAANGLNVLKHDEVFYVLHGYGELEVDGERLALEPGTAVFMYKGASIVLRQTGDDDLVVIIAYPPAERPR